MNAIVISGSRNTAGQTARAAAAWMEGFTSAGGTGETVFLPQAKIERCRQCDDSGWGACLREGRCVIADDFAAIADKIAAADIAVFATPVYFSDLSESLKTFLDRLRRVNRFEAARQRFAGKPAMGICVAGGGGGGAPSCGSIIEKMLATCGLDVIDIILARRQNLPMKLDVLNVTGRWLAGGK